MDHPTPTPGPSKLPPSPGSTSSPTASAFFQPSDLNLTQSQPVSEYILKKQRLRREREMEEREEEERRKRVGESLRVRRGSRSFGGGIEIGGLKLESEGDDPEEREKRDRERREWEEVEEVVRREEEREKETGGNNGAYQKEGEKKESNEIVKNETEKEEEGENDIIMLPEAPNPSSTNSTRHHIREKEKDASKTRPHDSNKDKDTKLKTNEERRNRKWDKKYLGDFISPSYSLVDSFSSSFSSSNNKKTTTKGGFLDLKEGDQVTLERSKMSVKSNSGKKGKKKKENTIVRFRNQKGFEVGRLEEVDAKWIAKLLDFQICTFIGTVVACPDNLTTGCTIYLSLRAYFLPSAFSSPSTSTIPNSNNPFSSTSSTTRPSLSALEIDQDETGGEKKLRERQKSLEKLWEKVGLRSVRGDGAKGLFGKPGEKEKRDKEKKKSEKDKKGKAKSNFDNNNKGRDVAGDEEEEEEEEEDEEGKISEKEIDKVFHKSTLHHLHLPLLSPPSTFNLHLRDYQKQALGWMASMETGDENGDNGERSGSMHPLWEEYVFPKEPDTETTGEVWIDDIGEEKFYSNPYSGELSLEFPKASKRTKGGILADEMGLGKTVMLAALIHTNRPFPSHLKSLSNSTVAETRTTSGTSSKQSKTKRMDNSFIVESSDVDEGAGGESNDGHNEPDREMDVDDEVEEEEERQDLKVKDGDEDYEPPMKKRRGNNNKRKSKKMKGKENGFSSVVGDNDGVEDRSGSSSSSDNDDNADSEEDENSHPHCRAESNSKPPHATLVVAPMTLLNQWKEELERCNSAKPSKSKGGGGGFKVGLYYGQGRGKVDKRWDVVVTSYGTLASEYAQEEQRKEEQEQKTGGGAKRKRSGHDSKGKDHGRLLDVEWYRVVLDEAHNIKSRITRNAKACYKIKAQRRWAVTGTPIVNRLEDLYSLLHFIRLEPWGGYSFFRSFVTIPFDQGDPKAMDVIQVILEGILLRREKKMKDLSGQPLVPLPKKTIINDYLTFTPSEQQIYDAIYLFSKREFMGYAKKGTILQNVTAIFAILMRLRLCVLHPGLPFLGKKIGGDGDMGKEEREIVKMIEKYNNLDGVNVERGEDNDVDEGEGVKYTQNVLKDLLGQNQERDDADEGEDECMICMDTFEAPVYIRQCMHKACKACILDFLESLQMKGEDGRCPICSKGPTTERDLLELAHRRSVTPPKSQQNLKSFLANRSSDDDDFKIDDDAKELSGRQRKRERRASSSEPIATTTTEEEEVTFSDGEKAIAKPIKPLGDSHHGARRKDFDDNDKDFVMSSSPIETKPLTTTQVPEASDKAAKGKGKVYLRSTFKSSTKLDKLLEHLEKLRTEDPKLKAVIFSQFTRFMNLIEKALDRKGFRFVRLDGTLSQKQRTAVIEQFNDTKKGCLFLASLKAGGTGLNLTSANHVFLMDCWWNAAIEEQAIDRVHRFGQAREVRVVRLLISPSIDDRMVQLQTKKSNMVEGALRTAKGDKKKDGGVMIENLKKIFED